MIEFEPQDGNERMENKKDTSTEMGMKRNEVRNETNVADKKENI